MFNTNNWNRIRYTFHSFYYDFILYALQRERVRALNLMKIPDGESVLIIGAGTGLDLPYINPSAEITAIDITPAMISKLDKRSSKLGIKVQSYVMDGMQLEFPDKSFDYVILNLILAVIPDPYKCIKEAERVLKDGGEILIFDKFIKDNKSPSILRKLVNPITSFLFSDINRSLPDIIKDTVLRIKLKENSLFNGTFKIYILSKM